MPTTNRIFNRSTMLKSLAIGLLLAASHVSAAESPSESTSAAPQFQVNMTGSVGIAGRENGYLFSFGGPRIAVNLPYNIQIAASFYPSMVASKLFNYKFRPNLGVGPEISYKKVYIFAPTYYLGTSYQTFVGLGYRF